MANLWLSLTYFEPSSHLLVLHWFCCSWDRRDAFNNRSLKSDRQAIRPSPPCHLALRLQWLPRTKLLQDGFHLDLRNVRTPQARIPSLSTLPRLALIQNHLQMRPRTRVDRKALLHLFQSECCWMALNAFTSVQAEFWFQSGREVGFCWLLKFGSHRFFWQRVQVFGTVWHPCFAVGQLSDVKAAYCYFLKSCRRQSHYWNVGSDSRIRRSYLFAGWCFRLLIIPDFASSKPS